MRTLGAIVAAGCIAIIVGALVALGVLWLSDLL